MTSLKELYSIEWDKISDVRVAGEYANLSGPLLMNLNSYYKQSIKLLIVGQQTKYWATSTSGLDELLDIYEGFNLGSRYWSSPFWNITRKIENLIGVEKYSCAWSNINRFDQDGVEPHGVILDKITELDYILKEEIKIIKPDICIFYTHNRYDYRLKKLYNNLKFENIQNLPHDQFSKLSHTDLPKYTYRTPHPKSIRLRKWENSFLTELSQDIPG